MRISGKRDSRVGFAAHWKKLADALSQCSSLLWILSCASTVEGPSRSPSQMRSMAGYIAAIGSDTSAPITPPSSAPIANEVMIARLDSRSSRPYTFGVM